MTVSQQPMGSDRDTDAATVDRPHEIRIFIVFFLLFALLTKTHPSGWGDYSRMAQLQSMAENGSLIIDKSIFVTTGDKYFFNGHFYSDKPPILALYAVPFYILLKSIGISFQTHVNLAYYLITLCSIGSLSALGLTLFRRILKNYGRSSDEWADIATFITGAGSLILPYSLLFNNHIASGVLILAGFYYILELSRCKNSLNAIYAGFLFSLAGSIDITCFLFIPFMLFCCLRQSIDNGIRFAIACLPMIALYFSITFYTSGSFTPPAMNPALWDYPGSVFGAANLSGVAKHETPIAVLRYAFHMLIGNRGLFSHTPLLILSAIALAVTYKQTWRSQYRVEYSCLFLASLTFIGSYIFRTVDYSGDAFGVRWFSSIMLIFCLPIASLEGEVRRSSSTIRTLFVWITYLSVLIAMIGAIRPFTPLPGSLLEERLYPTNTIWANIGFILTDLSRSGSEKKHLFVLGRLAIALGLNYWWFNELMGKLTLSTTQSTLQTVEADHK
jgi:hypothetical protein